MKKVYRTAMGKQVDMDSLRLMNEETIALGNMKVNARGDELGAGGKIVKSRNQIMDEYYKLNTPVAVDTSPIPENDPMAKKILTAEIDGDLPPPAEPITPAEAGKLKGSLATAFSKK